jgi:regulator of protease activity HflC (stomatin/prohibitin superfamily)
MGRTRVVSIIIMSGLGLILLMLWGCPQYFVWQRELSGKAQLAEAEWNRRIKIQEAEATKESAKHLADAEIQRAKGVAEANKIIGESLKGNDSYLRYLWIQGLNDSSGEVIYVPTEANLPILEAGKRK